VNNPSKQVFTPSRHKGGRGRRASFSERLFAGSKLLSVQGVKVGEVGEGGEGGEGGGRALASVYQQAQNYYQYKA